MRRTLFCGIHVPVDLDVKLVHLLVVLIVLGEPPRVAERPPCQNMGARKVLERTSTLTAPHVTAGVAYGHSDVVVEFCQVLAGRRVTRMATWALRDGGADLSPGARFLPVRHLMVSRSSIKVQITVTTSDPGDGSKRQRRMASAIL